MIPKAVRAVFLFCISFVLLNIILMFGIYHAQSLLVVVQTWLAKLTPAGGLTVLFFIQEILLILLLSLSLYFWKSTYSLKQWWIYFVQRRKWKGRYMCFRYVGGGLLIYFLCNIILALFIYNRGIEIPGLFGEQMTMTMLEELPLLVWSDYVRIIILTMIVGPIIEELIYRGFITDILMQAYGGIGVFFAASLFAIAHMEWGVILNLFILSLFLGYIYRKTRSMLYSFLFHMIINGLAVMAMITVRWYPELVVGWGLF